MLATRLFGDGAASRQWPARLVDAIFPDACALCDAPGRPLCAPCIEDARRGLDAACARCAVPLPAACGATRTLCGRCLRRHPAFERTVAAALYEPPFDQLVHGLKYGATLAYAPLFAALLDARIRTTGDPPPDVVVPVPLSRARLAARGFNQATEIARPLARRLGVPMTTDAVLRVVDTAPQTTLPIAARRRNVRGAFAVVDARRDAIAGRRVALVDDVMTTGATLDALARTLVETGAAEVVALVVARTP